MRSGGSDVSAGAVRAAGVSHVPGESGAERRERRCGRRERRAYRESSMEGCAELEGERGAEGGAVSPPASARPEENLGEGGRERGSEYRGWVGEGDGRNA